MFLSLSVTLYFPRLIFYFACWCQTNLCYRSWPMIAYQCPWKVENFLCLRCTERKITIIHLQWAIFESPIRHPVCPPKFCVSFVLKFLLGLEREIKNNANAKFWGTNKVYQDGRVENTEWWVVISISNWAKNTRVCYDLKRLCNLPVGNIFICTYKAERWTAFRCVLRPRRQKLDNPSPRHSSGPCFIYYVVQGRA